MAGKKKLAPSSVVLRVGLVICGVAMVQACHEGTTNYGYDFSAALATGFVGLVVVVAAFAVRAWEAMGRDDADE